ncbi:hypothetical protein HUJ05_002053 [Dendroctonus ponderosae]|nr:hypothetical protein HUJ05_002053 [Dendroctonus ponderosae]
MEETDIEEINKNIVNAIKEAEKECCTHNTREIARTIEENKSLKVLRQNMSTGRKTIHRLKNSQG